MNLLCQVDDERDMVYPVDHLHDMYFLGRLLHSLFKVAVKCKTMNFYNGIPAKHCRTYLNTKIALFLRYRGSPQAILGR